MAKEITGINTKAYINLIRLQTYADWKGFSYQWCNELVKKERVKQVVIDGMKFIKLSKDEVIELEEYRKR